MSKNININSSEWCDFIFKNRNKAYGAYKMRQSSFKDHIIAFGITILVLLTMIWITPTPTIKNNYNSTCGGGCGDPSVELEIALPHLPQPPKMHRNTSVFYEPAVTPDDKIIKMEGDNNTGVLYKEGVHTPLALPIITIENNYSIPMELILSSTTHCPMSYPIDDGGNAHSIDTPPNYPGGNEELYKYLRKNLQYPAAASEMGIQGKVLIRFTISKTGHITNLKITRSLNPICDKEAIRLIESMPAWIPAKSAGKPISISFILPIQFNLI